MTTGQIILLNGTSSAGKTSLVRALQQTLEQPFLDAGIDKFLWMLPKRYLNPPLWSEVFRYDWPPEGGPLGLRISAGPLGHQLVAGMHRAIAVLALAGNHVVADHVLLDPAWVVDCAAVLGALPTLFVGVRCPLHVVEQRERDRRDRTLGQARAQFSAVHAHGRYDLEVDTSLLSPEACAEVIKQRLAAGLAPSVLRELIREEREEREG